MNAAKSPLVDQEKIRFYEENGFLRLEECLTSEDVEDLRNLVERYVKSGFKRAIVQYGRNPEYDKVFHQVVNVWRESEDFRRHVFNPAWRRPPDSSPGAERLGYGMTIS